MTDENFRAERDAEMRSQESWLTMAGLYWLDEDGERSAGAGEARDIGLPASAPRRAFTVRKSGVRVYFAPAPGLGATIGDEAMVEERLLASDRPGPADIVSFGPLRLWLIDRSGRLALRLRDLEAEAFKAYSGLEWFPVSSEWRFKARLESYPEARKIKVGTAIGTTVEMSSPGEIVFSAGGEERRLIAFRDAPADPYFIVFRDLTSGRECYGAGRFLEATDEADGSVDLDFNKATNPACAYSSWATCPRPPEGNALALRVEAGEKVYRGPH
jgi:uncharacterized protein